MTTKLEGPHVEASPAAEEISASGPLDMGGADLPMDPKICRLCLMAAIVFAFGKEAALLI